MRSKWHSKIRSWYEIVLSLTAQLQAAGRDCEGTLVVQCTFVGRCERGSTSGAQGICTVPVISWIDFSPGIAPTDRFTRKGMASSAAARISSRLYQYASVSHQQKAQARLLLLVVFFAALHSVLRSCSLSDHETLLPQLV